MDSLMSHGGSEQDRDHRERYNMASYLWSPDSTHLLFDADGRLWLYDLHNGTGVQLGFTGAASGDDPKFSPDGLYVSFIRDHGALGHPFSRPWHALPSPLRPPPTPRPAKAESILNGEVDWVYEEELDVRSNYFWSPDSKNIAYLQMNETAVPQYPLTDWIPTHAQVEWQTLSPARRRQPARPRGHSQRQGRQDRVDERSPSRPATISRALGGSIAKPCGSKPSAAITSAAHCFLPVLDKRQRAEDARDRR